MNIARGEWLSGRFEKHTPGLQSTEKMGETRKEPGGRGGGWGRANLVTVTFPNL